MKIRSMALLLGALMLAAAPAQAQSAQRTYVASATAVSAQVLIGGQGLQLGYSSVGIRSDAAQKLDNCEGSVVACAHAATVVGGNDAKASTPGTSRAVGEPSGELPEQFGPLLSGHLGKAEAGTETGKAGAKADLVHLELNAVKSFTEQAPQIQDGLKQISDGLLGPMAEGDPSGELGPRLKETVDSLVANLSENPLVKVDILPSVATVEDKGGVVTASAVAYGALVVISPTAVSSVVAPEGLIIVEVGEGRATASSDGTPGDNHAAVVHIKIFNPATQKYDDIEVAAGEYHCGGEGTPLETCVGLGAVKAEAGAAQASGVSIDALAGQLKIQVGQINTGAAAAQGAPAAGPVEPAPLPHTGGGAALPALTLLGMAGGGMALIRRRSI
jgi:hypothetical protein